MKKLLIFCLSFVIIFTCFVSAKSLDYENIENLDLIYANKFTVSDLLGIRATYGIIEIDYKPLGGSVQMPEFYTFSEYMNNLQNISWNENFNPLEYFTEEELEDYYNLMVESSTASAEIQNKSQIEGPVHLSFYLKIEDGINTYQFIDTSSSFDYYGDASGEYIRDEEGYAKIKEIDSEFTMIEDDGSYNYNKTARIVAKFDENGIFQMDSVVEFDNISSTLNEIISNIGNVEVELEPLTTKKFTEDDIQAYKRILSLHEDVFHKMENFEFSANIGGIETEDGNTVTLSDFGLEVNEYFRPLKIVDKRYSSEFDE